MGFYVQSHYTDRNGVPCQSTPCPTGQAPGVRRVLCCIGDLFVRSVGVWIFTSDPGHAPPSLQIFPPFSATLLEPMPGKGPVSTGPALPCQGGQTPIWTPQGRARLSWRLALRPHPSARASRTTAQTPASLPQMPPSECPGQTWGRLGRLAVILIKILLQTLLGVAC